MLDTWKLKRWLRINLGKSSFYHYLRFLMNRKNILRIIDKYAPGDKNVYTNIKKAWIKLHWSAEEYFYFGYEEASEAEKRMFVPEYEKNIFCDKPVFKNIMQLIG